MPRRRRPKKRERPRDHKYGSRMVTRVVNSIMKRGKRSVAERIFYNALDIAGEKTGKQGIDIFEEALKNIRPTLEIKSRRIGGATYQVPTEVKPERATALAIRWLLNAAKARNEHTMEERLASELVAASKNEGAAIKKKEDTHKMAEANRAFAHFRF